MDFSKLPKIRDEDREDQFGYVHGVSGPGKNKTCSKVTLIQDEHTAQHSSHKQFILTDRCGS